MNRFIKVDPRICYGKPVIAGTRIPVTVVLDQLAAASSVDEVLKKYPELTAKQIAGVLRYCHSVIEHTELEAEAV
jgi:uncharacterized protein (DUF433 family)